jgi:hypothetical protein
VPGVDQTYGRDANSTDTGDSIDWHPNGAAGAPTPADANSVLYFAPHVFIQADPAWIPMLVPASGGPVVCNLKIGNAFSTVQVKDFWTTVVLPNGTVYGPLLLRQNRSLPPSDSLNVTITQWVPATAPAGFYRYDVHVGTYPSTVTDLSTFYFQKNGQGGDNSESWPAPETSAGRREWTDGHCERSEAISPLDQAEQSNSHCEQSEAIPIPETLDLKASPNPFNNNTLLELAIPQPGGDACIQIFDLAGRMVRSLYLEELSPGRHGIPFDGQSLSSGIYMAVLKTPATQVNMKLVLIK